MQIQLVIGEQDERYVNNLLAFLEKNYLDKFEMISFSNPKLFLEYLRKGKADVILIGQTFGVLPEDVRGYERVAYLCDNTEVEDMEGIRGIAKYKKPDLIFRDILDLYAESSNRRKTLSGNSIVNNLVLVTGMSGGTGASTFAVALARNYAAQGEKTLYFNLETLGESSMFFSGVGSYGFEDIIFALKSQKADIQLKMESAVRQDKSGVYYFEPCETAMYMLELTSDNILNVLSLLHGLATYKNIVVDMNFRLDNEFFNIMDLMDKIVVVGDGSELSNRKFLRASAALQVMEIQKEINIMRKMSFLYNRFSSSKSSNQIMGLDLPVLGVIPPIKHALTSEIIQFMLQKGEIFQAL